MIEILILAPIIATFAKGMWYTFGEGGVRVLGYIHTEATDMGEEATW
jgi:hypothetical protein